MSDSIITVENLSKCFVISHEEREHYTSLRDVIARQVKKTFYFGGKTTKSSSSIEDFWALKDINLEIKQGDRVGILGRNGAGKSTLLKVLSRITEPTTGRVIINGRVSCLLEVGTGFHPELTGRENIFLNGAILGMSRAEIRNKFDEIVAFAEVEQFLDTPVKRYSSGMYVRLAFSVAAHLEPEILVVDEVLAVGDAQFQKKCLGKMEDASKNEGRTVLFVSHNMQALLSLCKKGIYLERGRLKMFDEINKTINTYLQESNSVKSFVNLVSFAKIKSDRDFKLNDIIFYQDSQRVFGNISNGHDILIEVHYEIKTKLAQFRVFFDVCDTIGTVIFRSFHDEKSGNINSMLPGKYISSVIIPANLLAPIAYDFNFMFGIHNIRMVQPTEGVSFRINVEQTGVYNLAYNGQYTAGIICPTLSWKIQEVKI